MLPSCSQGGKSPFIMTEQWCGSLVSIDCGKVLGVYEGEVSNVDSNNQTISLTNVTRNSIKCEVAEVTLRSRDIVSIQILRSSANRTTEKPQIGQTKDSAFAQPVAVKKVNKIESPLNEDTNKKKEVKKKAKRLENRRWQSNRDEACFNVPVDQNIFSTDFDFEKNLALFDKQAVFEEINALSKGDHPVRLVDCNKRSQPKYRHDENILAADVPVFQQIMVPCFSQNEFVTDSGLVVPTVTPEFRELLFKKAEEFGLSREVRQEMTGRAASDMVLQLLGGSHRLNPQNSHQKPTVVVICGYHAQGIQGLVCARHLANHNVNVTVLVPPLANTSNKLFSRGLNLFSLTGGTHISDINEVPSAVDIIVGCLDSHDPSETCTSSWHQSVKQWANESKAPILCLDPFPETWSLNCKWVLWPVLPYVCGKNDCSTYICDIGLPKGVFTQLESSYSSPFGSKFIIPLYTNKK